LKRGISSDEAIGYNIYTDSNYRGNKIVNAVWAEIFNFLKRKKYKRLIHYVASQNLASMKVTSKVFKKKINTLYYISVLGFGKYFLSKRVK